ncbi:N-acetyl-gamma-glutamyl-phosphate reductase [Yunchengibacter salinarum]|uniref:N-acetyl-gamma-glutamyl-phosphate reductase n=1 Tax=Yunchengibacter salinarum TaxID=3133399 RepID=UPI0035B5A393
MTQPARVGILGASGYTGGDLVRLLARHPHVEIVLLTAERRAGQPIGDVFPHLSGLGLPDMIALDEVEWPAVELDAVFCALPHATSQAVIRGLMHDTGHTLLEEFVAEGPDDLADSFTGQARIIDLSADFRLRDVATYARWYGRDHQAADLQKKAVYGLPELYRDQIRSSHLVACPGCYPTAALIGLAPLLEAGLITPDGITIDAKSGASGAGRGLKDHLLFAELNEGFKPYGVGHHRHMPEIEQELSRAAGGDVTISFTPHLVPMNRGQLETIYVTLAEDRSVDDLRAYLIDRFSDEPFVHVLREGQVPNTSGVKGSNMCHINVFADRIQGRAIVVSAIDNLVKGSSGQAIQAMNLMLGYEEKCGLEQVALFP